MNIVFFRIELGIYCLYKKAKSLIKGLILKNPSPTVIPMGIHLSVISSQLLVDAFIQGIRNA